MDEDTGVEFLVYDDLNTNVIKVLELLKVLVKEHEGMKEDFSAIKAEQFAMKAKIDLLLKEQEGLKKKIAVLQTSFDCKFGERDNSNMMQFPIGTMQDLEKIEELLSDSGNKANIENQLRRILDPAKTFQLQNLIKAELLCSFNLKPNENKKGLLDLGIISTAMDILGSQISMSFAYQLKQAKDKVDQAARRKNKKSASN
ncbi:uncharacterized protein LOC129789604 [Lutzomyia longipalpis]|uniref:uncharacterized protein LOC129789604 n=1 Tax=Lutzomyia longipalpis TaxID=7200 RepID=UPI00248462A1|nr:uncharacterized protein LOC129789604 [Lutzomyia longipalpis]XP_055682516.1 uncharacterized protein LOC129789604 [Lutzomyia longipalpis]XP_055682517.1 uncharacterized protein LOC129789604 [Lutzomyia longipalpis]